MGRREKIVLFKYMKGCHLGERRELLLLVAQHRSHNNGFTIQMEKYWLNIRDFLFFNSKCNSAMELAACGGGEFPCTSNFQAVAG